SFYSPNEFWHARLGSNEDHGHTQMTTFQRYVNITEEAARNGAERLDALLNSQSRRNRSSNVLQLRRNN
ncbi:MAG TPA: hypothetical protein VJW17_06600, partial [Pyrinomonadaceae bacterium]|nr:hypothetical protein [Pyrinomonadaceae bacterium]